MIITSTKSKQLGKIFRENSIKAIDILKKLKPRVKTQLIIPPITISKTKSLISKLSNSNARGWDNITNRILKKIPDTVAPFITHLFNSIIKKSLYPLVFKISKVLPQMKPDKDPFSLDLFRPINNLPTIEKLFEAYVMECFIPFLEENYIIDCCHHGGLKLHSPETAMAAIQKAL